MNRHSLRWGATASGALTGFYVAVVGASGGWEHLRDQARTDSWLLMSGIVNYQIANRLPDDVIRQLARRAIGIFLAGIEAEAGA